MVGNLFTEEQRQLVMNLIEQVCRKKKIPKPMQQSIMKLVMTLLTPPKLPEGSAFLNPGQYKAPSPFEFEGPWSVLNGTSEGVVFLNLKNLIRESTKVEVNRNMPERPIVRFVGEKVAVYEGAEAEELIADLKEMGFPIADTDEEAEHFYNQSKN